MKPNKNTKPTTQKQVAAKKQDGKKMQADKKKSSKKFLWISLSVGIFAVILIAAIITILVLNGNSSDQLTGTNGSSTTAFSPSEGIDQNGYWKGVKALNYVEMFDYKALPIPKDVHEVSDETLQNAIDGMLANYSSDEQITDRAIKDGDTVNIDYVGSVDGVEFEGGSTGGGGTDVTIGVTSYIDDFLEQLIGHKPGETFDVNVTFPDEYPQNPDLAKKPAVFVTTINYIAGETITPELTDEFVAEKLSEYYGWKTIEEMKAGKREEIQNNAIKNYISEYLINKVAVKSVPDKMIQYQIDSMVSYFREGAESNGMDYEEFLSQNMGVANEEELIAQNSEDTLKTATNFLVIQAVAEDMGLTVSDENMTKFFTEQTGSSDYSTYEEQYGLPFLKQSVLSQMVFDYILDNAVLS